MFEATKIPRALSNDVKAVEILNLGPLVKNEPSAETGRVGHIKPYYELWNGKVWKKVGNPTDWEKNFREHVFAHVAERVEFSSDLVWMKPDKWLKSKLRDKGFRMDGGIYIVRLEMPKRVTLIVQCNILINV